MPRAEAEFKRRMLRLLKEDEEFRYAIVGLLGIEDVRSGQARLEEAYTRLEQAHVRLEEAVAKLAEAQTRTELALQELTKQVGRLSETIGFGLEDIARVVVPGWLYRHEGILVDELTRKFFTVDGEEIEINLYGEGSKEGMKVIIVGEVRSRIYAGDVESFDKLVERIKATIADRIYKLMFGYYIHPSAEYEAKSRGITLIASYMR